MTFYSDPHMMEELAFAVMGLATSGIPTLLLHIATYILSAMALYTLAVRRGIRKAWLSWIPVLNVWILGSLSDQYRDVVKGQIKSKRKFLLAFRLTTLLCGTVVFGTAVYALAETVMNIMGGSSNHMILKLITGPVITAACVSLPIFALSIASAVIRYMALYDIYTSMDPSNNVLFLVLSIFFGVTEPFFLFFNRNRDDGMPPRKQPPVSEEPPCQPEEPFREFRQEETTYL